MNHHRDTLNVTVKKLSSNAKLPTPCSDFAAGSDLYAAASLTILPHGKAVVPTDISIAIDDPNYYARVAPRSGLAVRSHIDVGAGVVDYDYRGPIAVVLFNHDPVNAFAVNIGDRVAQLVFERIAVPIFAELEPGQELPSTARGVGGFGSTGK